MDPNKKLLVTVKYGPLQFAETAWPYNENAHEEQVETCLESIAQQIDDAGKAEMTEAFTVEEQIVEEKNPWRVIKALQVLYINIILGNKSLLR